MKLTEGEQEVFERALVFAYKKHDGQYRKGGEPYIVHPISVCERVKELGYGLEYQVTALFHDLLEDTDATEREIEDIGGKNVLEAVKRLTKQKGYVMDDYVEGIRQNGIAFVVKGADRLHNLRSAYACDDDFRRRYVLETLDYYMDFDVGIPKAVKLLAESIKELLSEEGLSYEFVDDWKK